MALHNRQCIIKRVVTFLCESSIATLNGCSRRRQYYHIFSLRIYRMMERRQRRSIVVVAELFFSAHDTFGEAVKVMAKN